MRTFVGLIFLMICSSFLTAQTAIQTKGTSEKVKHYKGRIDDISDVTVSLDCQGKKCTGELTYLRSRDKFQLRGTRKGDLLQLQEYSESNKCTGYLNGKISGENIQLDWKNKEGTVGNSIKLKEVTRKPDFPSFCGDNKWINAYTGFIKDERVEMILQRVENNRLLGTAYFADQKQKVVLEGVLSDDKNLIITFVKVDNWTSMGTLRGVYRGKQNLSVSFYDMRNQQDFSVFELKKSLATSCLEYADYYTSYDFLFPKSEDAFFNTQMARLTKDWLENCRKNAQQIRKQTAKPEMRASQRGYSWTDITLLDDNFISGLLTYQATWTDGEATKTFNYDFNSGETLELVNLFKKGFNYQQWIKKYIADDILKTSLYKRDKAFRNWIKNEPFPYFTLEKEGMVFYTEFHIVYGRQSVRIPYKKLKANIRKNASIRALF